MCNWICIKYQVKFKLIKILNNLLHAALLIYTVYYFIYSNIIFNHHLFYSYYIEQFLHLLNPQVFQEFQQLDEGAKYHIFIRVEPSQRGLLSGHVRPSLTSAGRPGQRGVDVRLLPPPHGDVHQTVSPQHRHKHQTSQRPSLAAGNWTGVGKGGVCVCVFCFLL